MIKIRIYIFVLLSFLELNAHTQEKKDSILRWTESYKLTKSDFKGKAPNRTKWAAITTYLIFAEGTSTSTLPKYVIEARFNRYSSWMKVDSSYVIIHEQLHFDIAELFARKMRNQLSILYSRKEKNTNVYNKALIAINQACFQMQRKYDTETVHGTIFSKQKKWNILIDTKLKQMEKFALK